MAVKTGNVGVGNWNNKMFFPKQRYTITCIEEEFKRSEAGNPMLVRTFEIVLPQTLNLGDRTVNIAGQKFIQYRTIKVNDGEGGWDTKKSDSAWQNYRDELAIVGVPHSEEIDDENPPCHMKGKTLEAILRGNKSQAFADPTPEERAAGKRVGQPIKDLEGKDVIQYQINLDSILGLSETQVGVPY